MIGLHSFMNLIDRIERLNSRFSEETPEEKLIKANPIMSQRINDIYRRFGCIEVKLDKLDSPDMVVDKILHAISIFQSQPNL